MKNKIDYLIIITWTVNKISQHLLTTNKLPTTVKLNFNKGGLNIPPLFLWYK